MPCKCAIRGCLVDSTACSCIKRGQPCSSACRCCGPPLNCKNRHAAQPSAAATDRKQGSSASSSSTQLAEAVSSRGRGIIGRRLGAEHQGVIEQARTMVLTTGHRSGLASSQTLSSDEADGRGSTKGNEEDKRSDERNNSPARQVEPSLINAAVRRARQESKLFPIVHTIYFPAQNSSGDIYHAAAFMIISRIMNKRVPTCVLFYDTEVTKLHAQRAANFLERLGFSVPRIARAETFSYQPNVRLKVAKEAVLGLVSSARYCYEQRAITSMLVGLIEKHGRDLLYSIRTHIRNQSLSRGHRVANDWSSSAVEEAIRALHLHRSPFIILNLRVSGGANKKQNISLPKLERIISTLYDPAGIKIVILEAGREWGRHLMDKHNGRVYTIDAFPALENLPVKEQKFPHLFLLLKLGSMGTCRGVIGNTSGTLDMAAFMGFRTFCIHDFKSISVRNVLIPNQDLRIILQSRFMNIFDANLPLDRMSMAIQLWLEGEATYAVRKTPSGLFLEPGAFNINHQDRRLFCQDAAGNNSNSIFLAQYQHVRLDSGVAQVAFHGAGLQRPNPRDDMKLPLPVKVTRSSSLLAPSVLYGEDLMTGFKGRHRKGSQ